MGRVAGLIKYIRKNCLAGRTFRDFEDLTAQAWQWQREAANQREYKSTKRIVRLMFEAGEQKALLSLNPN